MHWLLLIALWGGLGFAFLEIIPLDLFWYIWIPLGIGFLIWGIHIEKRKMKNQLSIEKEKERVEGAVKQSLLEQYDLPIECQSFEYLNGLEDIPHKDTVNVWVKEDSLNLLTQGEDIKKYQISIGNINFYSVKGDIRQETENIGGDATLGETVVAEGLFGTAAAMKRNQVVQNVKTIDERKTIINADVEGENRFIFFKGADLYNYLLEQLPEKEQSFVAMNK